MSAKYRPLVILRQNSLTPQSHGLFATAKLLVKLGVVLLLSFCLHNKA